MKTEIKKRLDCFNKHWIDAFFVLKYKKSLTDNENIAVFKDWIWNVTWTKVKKQLEESQEKKE